MAKSFQLALARAQGAYGLHVALIKVITCHISHVTYHMSTVWGVCGGGGAATHICESALHVSVWQCVAQGPHGVSNLPPSLPVQRPHVHVVHSERLTDSLSVIGVDTQTAR